VGTDKPAETGRRGDRDRQPCRACVCSHTASGQPS